MLRREVPEAREILRRPGPEDLYDVINERSEKASIVLTSNRDRSEWPELFGEALLASAALDRLTHGRTSWRSLAPASVPSTPRSNAPPNDAGKPGAEGDTGISPPTPHRRSSRLLGPRVLHAEV